MLINKLRSRGLTGRKKKKDEGFTLVELLVVITILGILAAVVIAALSGIGDKGEAAARDSDKDIVSTQMEAYCAAQQGGTFEDPLILQREGFAGSQPGYTDVDVDKSQGPCGRVERTGADGSTILISEGASFTPWQPRDSYKDENGNPVSELITGCGDHRQEFTKVPTRAVVLDPQMNQIMIALGLEKDALMTSPIVNEVIPAQYREGRDAEYLTDHTVTIGTVGQYYSQAGFLAAATAPATAFDTILGTYRAQWLENAPPEVTTNSGFTEAMLRTTFGATPIHTYNGFAAGGCDSDKKADDSEAGIARSAMEGVFRDIRNVGIIFDVQDKAAALITDVRSKIAASLNKAGENKGAKVALIPGTGTTHSRYVGNHAFSGLANLAGGVNVYADEFQPLGRITAPPASVPWTYLTDKDPDVLVFLNGAVNPATGELDCNYDAPDVPGPPPAPAVYVGAAANPSIAGLRAWQQGNYVCGNYFQLLGASVFSYELIDQIANEIATL